MVIDMHLHPIFYKPVCTDEETLKFRMDQFGVWKQGPMDWDEIFAEMDVCGIEKSVMLPVDLTTTAGGMIISNDESAELERLQPGRMIGFASVDPHRGDAATELVRALDELGLHGLSLHPSKQKFHPDDPAAEELYRICEERNVPVIMHAGMSWEPDAPAKYGDPLQFEEMIMRHPDLRICLTHFAWPWVREMVMLMIKYPNVYTDTSVLYLDSPEESMMRLFTVDMGPRWFERGFSKQVMFASNTPRFRAFKLKRALDKVPMRKDARDGLYYKNALRFLYGKEYDSED